jgi:hypothetical protein
MEIPDNEHNTSSDWPEEDYFCDAALPTPSLYPSEK